MDYELQAEIELKRPLQVIRKGLLLGMNLVIGFLISAYLVLHIISGVAMPYPIRDWIMYPVFLVIQLSSALIVFYYWKLSYDPPVLNYAKYITAFSYLCIPTAAVHINPSLPHAFLWDANIYILMIYLNTILLGKVGALGSVVVALVSITTAAYRIGFDYLYRDSVNVSIFLTLWFLIYLMNYGVASVFELLVKALEKNIPNAVDNIKILYNSKREIEKDIELSRKIQFLSLPNSQEIQIPDAEAYGYMSSPNNRLCGDFYDIITYPDRTYFGIGDVTDHGISAGVVMLMAHSAIRSTLEHTSSIETALQSFNSTLYRHYQKQPEYSRAMNMLLIEKQKDVLYYVGQHTPFILFRGNKTKIIKPQGDSLGIHAYVKTGKSSLKLKKNDLLVFFTDGVTEAENSDGQDFDVEGVIYYVRKYIKQSVKQIAENLIEEVILWSSGNLKDDATVLLFRYRGD